MPIPILDKLISGFGGEILDANLVEMANGDSAETTIVNLGLSILSWNFDATTTDATDPGSTNVAINNAAKASATIISFNTTSAVTGARFDEALTRLNRNDGVFIQQRSAGGSSAFYRVTGQATIAGTRVNVPVENERTVGSEFADNALLNVVLFYKGAGDSIQLSSTTVNATDAASFSTSLAAITEVKGDAFRITTAGEPFTGLNVKAEVGDVIVAIVESPDVATPGDWVILRRPQIALIGRDDIDPNYRTVIEGAAGNTADISSLESKVDALFPLTVDVPILTAWADIYSPAQAAQAVDITRGYSLLADFRGTDAADRYESAGVTYQAGTNVSRYSGLSVNQQRVFGFEITGPSDLTLLSIVDGSEIIPFLDMTVAGNFRINNYTPSRTQDEVITNHPVRLTRSAGTGTLSVGGLASTYTVSDYPANTSSQSRTIDFDIDVLVNGVNTFGGSILSVDIPDGDVAQGQLTIEHVANLGPLHGNRRVDFTVGYQVRVVGPDVLFDLTLEVAPSDVTLLVESVDVLQSYTATVVINRVDDFEILQDQIGDYTFTGGQEIVIAFHPIANTELMEIVPVVRDASSGTIDELNDRTINIPDPLYDVIEVPDTIEFRTFLPDHFFIHRTLADLLRQDRDTQWVYGLARLNEISVHAVTEAIDLANGSTINGDAIVAPRTTVVLQVSNLGNLQQNLVLPTNYNTFDFLSVVEFIAGSPNEWRTLYLPIALLVNGDVGASDVIRIQGNSDFTWSQGSRTLVSQAGSTIYRAVLTNN